MKLPDFSFWVWLLIVIAFAIAIIIPFLMLVRIKMFRVLRNRAASKSRGALTAYWILLVSSYLVVVWLVFLFYFSSIYR